MNTHTAPERKPLEPGHARRAASTLGALLSLVLLPKCPLCIAAYLTSLGFGVSASAFAAPLVRPLAAALAATAFVALGYGLWRHQRRAPGCWRCPPTPRVVEPNNISIFKALQCSTRDTN
jgi:hypothetical protein